ncbi:MAG: lamin tail domain-containing protein, partial [Candidatus Pacebacteria bacterium]|nr:lamin tail domain-containing protein [Candidatus Paceibacterota bacterium]
MSSILKRVGFSLVFCFFYFSTAGASMIINEIAWMGDQTSYNHEWIELYNDSQRPITINDWVLKTTDEKIKIDLQGIVPGQGFFLLE